MTKCRLVKLADEVDVKVFFFTQRNFVKSLSHVTIAKTFDFSFDLGTKAVVFLQAVSEVE